MKYIIYTLLAFTLLTSCVEPLDPDPDRNYFFEMVGRCPQDDNGYYHIELVEGAAQTIHRFGAHVSSWDYGAPWTMPSEVMWRCDAFWYTPDTLGSTYIEIGNVPTGESPWSWENFAVTGYGGMTVPIVNGHSWSDPLIDSAFCIVAPVWEMRGDTVGIFGQAWFEEGDYVIYDSFEIIFD